MHVSIKKVIDLNELIGQRYFTLPRSMANDFDIVTGQPCLFVGVNGNRTYLPVEIPTLISYNIYCVLKDLGMNIPYPDYDGGDDLL